MGRVSLCWTIQRLCFSTDDSPGCCQLQLAGTTQCSAQPDLSAETCCLHYSFSNHRESYGRLRDYGFADWIGFQRLWCSNHLCLEPYDRSAVQMEHAAGPCLRWQHQQPDPG